MINGVPQGSVIASTLFNIYISDPPRRTYKKYNYADDITILHRHKDINTIENVLFADLSSLRP